MPTNFEEAFNHPDPKIRAKWRAGIAKEFLKDERKGSMEEITYEHRFQ